MQLDLFSTMRAPAIRRRVSPDGGVEKGEVDEVLILRHPRLAWHSARIELHRDRDSGLWMWSTSHGTSMGGGGYRVGAKWGNFANSRDDALYYAIAELREHLRDDDKETRRIFAWLNELMPL